jgi:4-amino-4-deoxy-L-arabinose transferase-like glycosyltransferase
MTPTVIEEIAVSRLIVRQKQVLLALFLLSVLAVHVLLSYGTASKRIPEQDEGFFASPAFTYITRGFFGTTAVEPQGGVAGKELAGIQQITYWCMPLDLFAEAAWSRIFGFGILQLRDLSILWAVIVICCAYSLVWKLTNNHAIAVLSLTLLAIDPAFGQLSNIGIMDSMCVALGYAGLTAYVWLRERRLSAAIAVGHTLVAASAFTHPNGIMPFVGLLILMFLLDRNRIRLPKLLLGAAPYLVGIAVYVSFILLHHPDYYLAQMGANSYQRFVSPLKALKAEIYVRYYVSGGWIFGLQAAHTTARLKVLILVSWFGAFAANLAIPSLRRAEGVTALLLLTGVYYFVLLFFNHKLAVYLLHVMPMFDAGIAVTMYWLWHNGRAGQGLAAAWLAGLLLIGLALPALRILHAGNPYREQYVPTVEFLKPRLGPDTVVIAPAGLGFGLGFNHVVHDESLGYYSRRRPPYIVRNADMEDAANDLAGGLRQSNRANPADIYRHIVTTLRNDYHKIFQCGEFKVFELNSGLPVLP